MRKLTAGILVSIALTLAISAQEAPKPAPPPPEPLKLKVGDIAPDFTLLSYDGTGVKPVTLSEFRGKKQVALAFFVFAFTGG